MHDYTIPLAMMPTPSCYSSTHAPHTPSSSVLDRNHVRIVGAGTQTLLFCNGFGCSQNIWRYISDPLSSHYRVVLFDHVGSGESERSAYDPQKYSTLAGYAQDLIEICQALDLRDVVVVAHSVGATIAMLAAIQAPQYFAKAVMIGSSPCYINHPGYYGGARREDMIQLLDLMDVDYDSWANMFAGLLIGSGRPASLGEELAGYFCNTDSTIAKRFARIAFLADNRADVPKLQLPTLLLQCADDAVVPSEVGDYMLAHLPHATLTNLQATGHCPHLSAPLEILSAIEPFLAQ
jgi:sigma-B regulation protein RsbQ